MVHWLSYNRYLDYLHYKASEILSLKSEAEYRLIEEVAQKSILKEADNQFVSDSTNLTIRQVEEIRRSLAKGQE